MCQVADRLEELQRLFVGNNVYITCEWNGDDTKVSKCAALRLFDGKLCFQMDDGRCYKVTPKAITENSVIGQASAGYEITITAVAIF